MDPKIWDINEPDREQFRLEEETELSDVYDDNLSVKYNLGLRCDFGDIYREYGNFYYDKGEYDMALAYYSRFGKDVQGGMRTAITQHQIANIMQIQIQ